MYNVLYDREDGTQCLYLAQNTDYKTAHEYCMRFTEQYCNTKHPYSNPRVVNVSEVEYNDAR